MALALSCWIQGAIGQERGNRVSAIVQWAIYEAQLGSKSSHDNPFWDVVVRVRFISPMGREQADEAFWDGGRVRRARFSPDEVGKWTWRSERSDAADTGLHGRAQGGRPGAPGRPNPLAPEPGGLGAGGAMRACAREPAERRRDQRDPRDLRDNAAPTDEGGLFFVP
ncbi:MAG: DUF5060 domain-containing protein [Planctomycetes bacterium]|nr:DUF5060 domain-containing protein [Planctomycetota bacterium]